MADETCYIEVKELSPIGPVHKGFSANDIPAAAVFVADLLLERIAVELGSDYDNSDMVKSHHSCVVQYSKAGRTLKLEYPLNGPFGFYKLSENGEFLLIAEIKTELEVPTIGMVN